LLIKDKKKKRGGERKKEKEGKKGKPQQGHAFLVEESFNFTVIV